MEQTRFDKEQIVRLYVNLGKSITHTAKELGLGVPALTRYLEDEGLKRGMERKSINNVPDLMSMLTSHTAVAKESQSAQNNKLTKVNRKEEVSGIMKTVNSIVAPLSKRGNRERNVEADKKPSTLQESGLVITDFKTGQQRILPQNSGVSARSSMQSSKRGNTPNNTFNKPVRSVDSSKPKSNKAVSKEVSELKVPKVTSDGAKKKSGAHSDKVATKVTDKPIVSSADKKVETPVNQPEIVAKTFSREEQIAYCDKKYGKGNYKFLGKKEFVDLMIFRQDMRELGMND